MDTFAALREKTAQRIYRSRNECFITGMKREAFDKAGLNFEECNSTDNENATNYVWN